MNRLIGIVFVSVFVATVVGCVQKPTNTDLEAAFIKNNHNFEYDKVYRYKGLTFSLPSFFERYYYKEFVVRQSAFIRNSPLFNVIVSIEEFDNEATVFNVFPKASVETDVLNALHDSYVSTRLSSLSDAYASIKKKLNKRIASNGLIQMVGHGASDENNLRYSIATLQINGKYYIIQWIAPVELMSYTYDDFERFLKGIKPIK